MRITHSPFVLLFLTSAAVTLALPANAQRRAPAAGRIPDGTYKCQTWIGSAYVSLGTIRSVNGSLDTSLLRKVGATFMGATSAGNVVTVNYTTARGYRESMDCTRQ